jgi:outer membrane receptor protein involved in Fe transport
MTLLMKNNSIRGVHLGMLCILSATPLMHDAYAAQDPESDSNSESSADNFSNETTLLVSAKRKPVNLQQQPSETEVTRDTIKTLPAGDQKSLIDLLAETVPGAVRGPLNRVFFRENEFGIRYQVDGILLPDQPSNALADPLAIRNIGSMTVLTGALPAEYGERMQSLVSITTLPETEKFGGEAELIYGTYNTTSPQLELGGSSPDNGFHYGLTANYQRTDRGLGTPNPTSETDQTQGGPPVHDQAHGNNEFAKLDWILDNSNLLSLILSNNQSYFQIPNYPSTFLPTDAFFQPTFTDMFGNSGGFNYVPSITNDSQFESNSFIEAAWKHTISEQSNFQIGTYFSYYNVRVDNDPANDLAALNLVPGSNPTSMSESRHADSVGVQGDYTLRTNDQNRIQAGFKASAMIVSGDFQILFQDPDNAGSILTSTDSSQDKGWMEGVYVQDEYELIPRVLLLNAGLRFDALQYNFVDANPRYTQLEPRVGLSYLPIPGTKLHAFYGRMFLPAPLEDLHASFTDVAGAGATLAPYDIKPETDNYFEIGLDQQLTSKTVFTLTGYYKDATNLLDDAQLLNTSLEQDFNWAHGYAFGAEASLKGELVTHLTGYANYGWGTARGSGLGGGAFVFQPGEAPTGGYQTLDHVQRSTINSGLIYSTGQYWGSLQALYGSGLPTGPQNSATLPSHWSFNMSASYKLLGDAWWKGTRISGDILNIFNNAYPISVANGYNGSYYAAGREFLVHLAKEF